MSIAPTLFVFGAVAALAAPGIVYEPNRGQTASPVVYLASTPRGTLYLTPTETVLQSEKGAVRWSYPGAKRAPFLPGPATRETHTYRKGRDTKQWVADIPTYQSVTQSQIYPGIDIVYHDAEYDFLVAPHADPAQIRIRFQTGTKLAIRKDGSLEAVHGKATFHHKAPVAYTESEGRRTPVQARFRRMGPLEVQFELGRYNNGHALTIDPEIFALELIGGADDDQVLAAGSNWQAGWTLSLDFPGPGLRQTTNRDAFYRYPLHTIVVGGSGDDRFLASEESSTYPILAGETNSRDFPVSAGAIQPAYGGGASDLFLYQFYPAGRQPSISATYLGGSGDDRVLRLFRSSPNELLLAGQTNSSDFPGSLATASQPLGGVDLLVARLAQSPATGFTVPHTRLLGTANDDTLLSASIHDSQLHLTSPSLWLAAPVASATTAAPTFTRLFSADAPVHVRAVNKGPDGAWRLSGDTAATDLIPNAAPNGRSDLFTLILPDPNAPITRGAYYGGSGDDVLSQAHLSPTTLTLIGRTGSPNLPVVAAWQPSFGGGATDGLFLVTDLDTATVRFSYLGGSGDDDLIGYCPACGELNVPNANYQTTGLPALWGNTTSADWNPATLVPARTRTLLHGGGDLFRLTFAPLPAEPAPLLLPMGLRVPLSLSSSVPVADGAPVEATVQDPSIAQISQSRFPLPGNRAAAATLLGLTPDRETRLNVSIDGQTSSIPLRTGRLRLVLSGPRFQQPDRSFGFRPSLEFVHDGQAYAYELPRETSSVVRVEILTPTVAAFPGLADKVVDFSFFTEFRLRATADKYDPIRIRASVPFLPEIEPVEIEIPASATFPTISIPFAIAWRTTSATVFLPAGRNARTLVIRSSDPGLIALSTSRAPNPSPEITLSFGTGSFTDSFNVHALAAAGTAEISASINGLPLLPVRVPIHEVILAPTGLSPAPQLSAPGPGGVYYLSLNRRDPETGALFEARLFEAGAASTVQVSVSNREIVGVSGRWAPETGGLAFTIAPRAPGRTLLRVEAMLDGRPLPVFTQELRVDPPAPAVAPLYPFELVAGEGLRAYPSLPIPAEEWRSVEATATVEDPEVVQVGTLAGPSAKLRFQFPFPFPILPITALKPNSQTRIRLDSPGLAPVWFTVRTVPVVAQLSLGNAFTSLRSQVDIGITFHPVSPETGRPLAPQERVGALPEGIRVTSSDPTILAIVPAPDFRFFVATPLGTGVVTVTLEQQNAPAAIGAVVSRTFPVEPNYPLVPASTISLGTFTQRALVLGYYATGAETLTVTSKDPARLLVSDWGGRLGQESMTFSLSPLRNPEVFLQSLGGPGRVEITVTAPGQSPVTHFVEIEPATWAWNVAAARLPEPVDVSRFMLFPSPYIPARLVWLATGAMLDSQLTLRPGLESSQLRASSDNPNVGLGSTERTLAPGVSELRFPVTADSTGEATVTLEIPDYLARNPDWLRLRVIR